MLLKGHKIYGPDGMGYELTRDATPGTVIMPSDFKPFGGAPKPEEGKVMPVWLMSALQARGEM